MDDNLIIFCKYIIFFVTIKNILFQLYKVAYNTHGITKDINWNITNLIYLSMGFKFGIPWILLAIFYG